MIHQAFANFKMISCLGSESQCHLKMAKPFLLISHISSILNIYNLYVAWPVWEPTMSPSILHKAIITNILWLFIEIFLANKTKYLGLKIKGFPKYMSLIMNTYHQKLKDCRLECFIIFIRTKIVLSALIWSEGLACAATEISVHYY